MVETVWISMKFPRFYIPNSHLISSHLKIPHLHIKIATPLLYQVCLLSLLQVLMMLQCKWSAHHCFRVTCTDTSRVHSFPYVLCGMRYRPFRGERLCTDNLQCGYIPDYKTSGSYQGDWLLPSGNHPFCIPAWPSNFQQTLGLSILMFEVLPYRGTAIMVLNSIRGGDNHEEWVNICCRTRLDWIIYHSCRKKAQ